MNADAKVTERQRAVWQALLRRRFDTASNLAVEFRVSVRTMQNDLHELMLSHPIESVRGRYGGGYKVADWYFPQQHTLCAEQRLLYLLKTGASSEPYSNSSPHRFFAP